MARVRISMEAEIEGEPTPEQFESFRNSMRESMDISFFSLVDEEAALVLMDLADGKLIVDSEEEIQARKEIQNMLLITLQFENTFKVELV